LQDFSKLELPIWICDPLSRKKVAAPSGIIEVEGAVEVRPMMKLNM